jgi:hypothetical protein
MEDRELVTGTLPVQVTGTPAAVKMEERTSTMFVYSAFTGTWLARRGTEDMFYIQGYEKNSEARRENGA